MTWCCIQHCASIAVRPLHILAPHPHRLPGSFPVYQVNLSALGVADVGLLGGGEGLGDCTGQGGGSMLYYNGVPMVLARYPNGPSGVRGEWAFMEIGQVRGWRAILCRSRYVGLASIECAAVGLSADELTAPRS
jgi:hypothetical protein